MTFPVPPAKGQPIRADLIRQIIDCLRMFRPLDGQNIRTQTTPGGTIINGTPGGASAAYGTRPWTVRKHVTDDDSGGKWEIWMPFGCMACGETLTPINLAASEVSGHDDDKPGWYLIKLNESEGAAETSTTGSGDDAVTTVSRTWDIIAHAKTRAKVYGNDVVDASFRRLLYVSARKRLTAAESAAQTAAQSVANTWGDEFSQVVATVTIGTRTQGQGEAQPFRTIEQRVSAPISVQGKAAAGFDLVWYFGVGNDGGLSVERVLCVRQVAQAAGMALRGPELTEVQGAETGIWAKIVTNPLAERNQVEVVTDPTNRQSDDFLTWLRLYDMTSDAVTADYRVTALANLQVYR